MGKIKETFKRLIKRHEGLRTSFHMVNDTPVQVVHDEVEFQLENYQIQNTKYKQIPNSKLQIPGKDTSLTPTRDANTIIKEFVRPFDLSCGPLLRVGLIDLAGGGPGRENRHKHAVLMVDMHHIISDGVSHEILVKDFQTLYEKELPPLRIQYKDFSQWQNGEKEEENLKRQEEYWLKEFAGEVPLLNLPTDHERPEKLNFEGSSLILSVDGPLTREIKACAAQMNVTPMMFLFSAYNVLLSKYTGQEDMVVGTVIAGRPHADLENIIGFFVNMLAIKTMPDQSSTFSEYLTDVKDKMLKAFENQDYPFEELVNKLEIKRHPGRHPLVDVVFVFRGEDQQSAGANRSTGTEAESPINKQIYKRTHFDLMLHVTAAPDSITLWFEYSTELFPPPTVEEFGDFYVKVLEQIVENPGIPLSEIKIDLNWVTTTSTVIQESVDEWGL